MTEPTYSREPLGIPHQVSSPGDGMDVIRDERELIALCAALGARAVPGFTAREATLMAEARELAAVMALDAPRLRAIRAALRKRRDPLGEAFCALRSPATRRAAGATYTPRILIDAMLARARACFAGGPAPARIIDPGTGSGRFLLAAGRTFPHARLTGVEIDPLAAMTARANLAASGMAGRASVIVGDYRDVALPGPGPALFLGNPPYVRHHDIPGCWKDWLAERAAARGLPASRLAGLHVHFLLATLAHARPGDVGVFVTSAEWLDTGYGQLARELLAGPLGGLHIDVVAATAQAFPDAQSTAAIACFRVGEAEKPVYLRRVRSLEELVPLARGRRVSRHLLASSPCWTALLPGAPGQAAPAPDARIDPGELVELGELCRVHRGQVTGANQIWIAGQDTPPLPARVLFAAVTRARELLAAGDVLADDSRLRRVIDLPPELDWLYGKERRAVERFLAWARALGADAGYVARHRSPWWSVRLREPPPILATYMARRPPAFVRNQVQARYLNIAHGLYPRTPLPEPCLDALAAYLTAHVDPARGRTYAGGLVKFEPGEMERILVPRPEALARLAGGNM